MFPGRGPMGTTSQLTESNERDDLRAQLVQLEKEEQDPAGKVAAAEETENTESKILGILGQFDNAVVSISSSLSCMISPVHHLYNLRYLSRSSTKYFSLTFYSSPHHH